MTDFVELRDGGRAAYELYGDDGGVRALLMHGFSDSRLGGRAFDAAARRAGVCLLAPDRPGIGLSTGGLQSFEDVGRWVELLFDGLGLERASLLGISGGAPFALAAARFVPERIERVVVVAGLGPPELGTAGMPAGQRVAIAAAVRAPAAAAAALAGIARLGRTAPSLFLRLVASSSGAADAAALRDPDARRSVVEPFVEAYRQGPTAVAAELRLVLRPWRFRLEDIGLPVHVEHGAADVTVPPRVARGVSARIPGATLQIREGAGHFTLTQRHGDEIMAVAAGPVPGA